MKIKNWTIRIGRSNQMFMLGIGFLDDSMFFSSTTYVVYCLCFYITFQLPSEIKWTNLGDPKSFKSDSQALNLDWWNEHKKTHYNILDITPDDTQNNK